jgi:hypothetical protein
MKIILTEEQYNTLIVENVIKDIFKDLNINTGVLFTFGTGMSSLLPVVGRLLEGDGISLTKTDLAFLLITSIAILIKDKNADKLVDAVEEKNQVDILEKIVSFTDKMFSFLSVLSKKFLNVSYGVAEILAFSLLLSPSMKVMTQAIEEQNITMENAGKLFTGVALASLVYGLKSVFKRLTNKNNEPN